MFKGNYIFRTFTRSFLDQYRKTPNIHKRCWVFLRGRGVIIGLQLLHKFDFCPHPQGVRSETIGFSHDLRNSPPDCFLPSLRSGRSFESQYPNKKSGTRRCGFQIFGRSIGIRTRGLLDPNQARYQTSPYPDCQNIILIFCCFVKYMQ